MKKKEGTKTIKSKTASHPLKHEWNFGQLAADKLTTYMGSWTFIIIFLVFLVLWMIVNTIWILFGSIWDPKPFIMLNLILSCLAAIQAPIILMSQNREAQKDRLHAQYDYAVNRKSEREIEQVRKQLDQIKTILLKKRK